jgi:hypothetical protein
MLQSPSATYVQGAHCRAHRGQGRLRRCVTAAKQDHETANNTRHAPLQLVGWALTLDKQARPLAFLVCLSRYLPTLYISFDDLCDAIFVGPFASFLPSFASASHTEDS